MRKSTIATTTKAAEAVVHEIESGWNGVIVGVAAAVHDQEVLLDLIKSLPGDPGFILLVMYELGATSAATMASLVAAVSSMKIGKQGRRKYLQIDHLYMIHPGQRVEMDRGKPYLGEKRQSGNPRQAVEQFYESLAETCRHRAVGVALAGMESRARRGLWKIKQRGGLAVVERRGRTTHSSLRAQGKKNQKGPRYLSARQIPQTLLQFAQEGEPRKRKNSRRDENVPRFSPELLVEAVEAAPDGFVILNKQGVMLFLNPAMERLFGHSRQEMSGWSIERLIQATSEMEEKNSSGSKGIKYSDLAAGQRWETKGRGKDGSVFVVEINVGTMGKNQHKKVFVVRKCLIPPQTLREFEAAKQELEQQLSKGMEALTQTQDKLAQLRAAHHALEAKLDELVHKERHQIGRDLHDGVGQQIAASALLASVLQQQVEANPSFMGEGLARLVESLQGASAQVRAMTQGILPMEVNAQGFEATLRDMAEKCPQILGVECEFLSEGSVEVMDDGMATHLYFIVQEAIRNAVKHGRARKVRIELLRNPQLTVMVRDDGDGFSENNIRPGGNGLHIMQHRARLLNGQLEITPNQPHGTIVTCVIPVKYDKI